MPTETEPLPASNTPQTQFKILENQAIPQLPDIRDKTKLDIRYPLIPPYAYAHIAWDDQHHELVYTVEEPLLTEEEQIMLVEVEKGIEEIINISFINVKQKDIIIAYLEENIQVVLAELGYRVDEETFLKMMYYVYRDFVGLNEIEPLMNDYFIEDIECNGAKTPLYIVHRKYRNIRTNIVFPDIPGLTSFVEKLAQKCGKYISYANPLLDGRLPDGSRINATFTEEISSRGPSFTVRKFTAEPFSPIKMMQLKTISPEILAYLWLAIEYESNFVVIGSTGSGKTSLLNGLAFFIPPQARIVSIEDSVTGDAKILLKKGKNVEMTTIEKAFNKLSKNKKEGEMTKILSINKNYKVEFVKPLKWIRHKVNKGIYRIITSTGREIKVTEDHSLFTLGEYGLKEIKPIDLKVNESCVAVQRFIPYQGREIDNINLSDSLKFFKDDFLVGEPLKKIFEKYNHHKKFGISKNKYNWWKKRNMVKIDHFLKLKYKFSYSDQKKLKINSKAKKGIPVIFPITDSFIEFIGLWIGDGSHDNYNRNGVIVSNEDKECIDVVRSVAKSLNFNISLMSDKISYKINSTIFYKFMKYVLGCDGYAPAKRVPSLIHNASNRQIKHFLRGYYSADGSPSSDYEITCSSQSYGLLEDIQTLYLRIGIIGRIKHSKRPDNCREFVISSLENKIRFRDHISFLQKRKIKKVQLICNKEIPHHTSSDIIPLPQIWVEEINKFKKLSTQYLLGRSNIGRNFLQNICSEVPTENLEESGFNRTKMTGIDFMSSSKKINFLKKLSESELLWDKVKKIEKLRRRPRWVYDISVPETEKFICSNILLHNTHELSLMHENWLPSVARQATGVGAEGTLGEVDLFALLKESFRQRPDYVIVGEIRGKEAFVLFQGAASGHATACTMHAEDVETMVKRLETPPISLSAALIEIIDIVCIMGQVKVQGETVRRLKSIVEIIKIEGSSVKTNTPFLWDPHSDTFFFKTESVVFQKIMKNSGLSQEALQREFARRTKLLMELYRRNITEYRQVQEVIDMYYKTPEEVMRRFGIE